MRSGRGFNRVCENSVLEGHGFSRAVNHTAVHGFSRWGTLFLSSKFSNALIKDALRGF
jgi:hypothetical protein